MASKTWTLQPNALCDLQTLKDELGVDSAVITNDQKYKRLINQASDQIERICGRKFSLGYTSEMKSISVVRSPRLTLNRTPILYAPSSTGGNPAWTAIGLQIWQDANPGPGSLMDSTTFDLEDPKKGWLFSNSRWANTAIRLTGVVRQDYEPGTDESTFQALYFGGYVTTPQVESTTASAPNTGITPKWVTATTYAVGALVVPTAADSGAPNQLWACTTGGVSGGSEPTWGTPANPGATVNDGTAVWTFAGPRNLPNDLEFACARLAAHWWLIGTGDLDVSSERAGSGGQTYSGSTGADGKRTGAGRAEVPDAVMSILRAYRRFR